MPYPLINTDDIELLRVQFRAWMDGVHACGAGIELYENPHTARSAAADSWGNGWEVMNQYTIQREHQRHVMKITGFD